MSDVISLTYDPWIFWIVLLIFFFLIVITVVGNALVFAALIRFTRLRSMSNLLIGNLALSDFLLALTILPLSALTDATGHWLFGAHLCDIWLAVDVFYCTASVWSLVAIAFDRFTATTFPIWYRSNQAQRRVLSYIVFVWVLSGLICLPGLLGWGSKPVEKLDHAQAPSPPPQAPMLNQSLRELSQPLSSQTHVFNPNTGRFDCVLFTEPHYVVYSAMGSFIIPLIIMLGLYLKIFIVLRARGQLLRQNRRVHQCSEHGMPDKRKEPTHNPDLLGLPHSTITTPNGPSSASSPTGGSRMARCECCAVATLVRQAGHIETRNCDREISAAVIINVGSKMEGDSGNPVQSGNTVRSEWLGETSIMQIERIPKPNVVDPTGLLSPRPLKVCSDTSVPSLGTCPPSPLVGLDLESSSSESQVSLQLVGNNSSENEFHVKSDYHHAANGLRQKQNVNEHEQPQRHKCDTTNGSSNNGTSVNGRDLVTRLSVAPTPSSETSPQRGSLSQMHTNDKTYHTTTGNKRWSASAIQHEREQARADYRERRATKRMGLIICIFILCWIPFTLMYLVRGLCGELDCPDQPHLRIFVTWLGYANSALNPILYALFNGQFRQAFITLLRCTERRVDDKSTRFHSH